MSNARIDVDVQCFPAAYVDKADELFLRPGPTYSWDEIISGVSVASQSGGTRRMSAVGQNTFRGFHRINKSCPGAKEDFVNYFRQHRPSLVDSLSAVGSRDDLHRLSNQVCDHLRAELDNCVSAQLEAYNKIRKPVDIYIEHVVAMAEEMNGVRAALTPLLYLPLDSQIVAHPGLFTDRELAAHGLSRTSTYKDIGSEQTYVELQSLLGRKAEAVSTVRQRPFHVIYFDLLWNNRDQNWGGNLFETNP